MIEDCLHANFNIIFGETVRVEVREVRASPLICGIVRSVRDVRVNGDRNWKRRLALKAPATVEVYGSLVLWMRMLCCPGRRGRCTGDNGTQRRGGVTALRGRSGCCARCKLRWGRGALMSLGTGTRSRGCGHAWCVGATRTSERRCEWHGRCAVGTRIMARPGECKHTRVTTISVGRCLIVSGRQGHRHCGRWGG